MPYDEREHEQHRELFANGGPAASSTRWTAPLDRVPSFRVPDVVRRGMQSRDRTRSASRRRHRTTSTCLHSGRSTDRSATSACARRARSSIVDTADEFADFCETDPHSPPVVRDPISEDIDVVVLGGGFAGLIAGARLKQAGVDGCPHHRDGRGFRRRLVLEPLSRHPVRQRSYCYLPLLEELSYIPSKKFADGAEIYRALPAHRQAFRPLRRRAVRHAWSARCAGTKRSSAGGSARTTATTSAPASSSWPRARATGRSCPASPASRASRGTASTRRAGTMTTPAADQRPAAGQARRQARRDHRHRRDRRSRSFPILGRYAKHLYVFQRTPSCVDERGNQPTDPEWAKIAEAGLAEGAPGELPCLGRRSRFPPAPGTDLDLRLLDRDQPQHGREAGRDGQARADARAADRAARAGRLPGDGAAAPPRRRASSRTRRPPRR